MKLIKIFVLSLFPAFLWATNISGYVADEETGETIIGANVTLDGTTRGASTDKNGFFIIRNISTGKYILHVSFIGYDDYTKEINVGNTDLFVKRITLKPRALQGEVINVTARHPQIIQKDMDIASFEADPVILKEVPQLGKDVFKLIKLSPSVTISDPLSTLFYVRGSDPGENLVQLDGMTIYNPQHLLGQQAIFNPYAIKNIEMLVGGFDAEFGGRNSSILYITSREGHKDAIKVEFHPTISGLQGALEFPVHENGTAMVSGRVLSNLVAQVLMSMPNALADFNGAYQARFGKTRLRFSAFYAKDYVDYDFKRLGIFFEEEFFSDYSTGFLTNTNNYAIGIQSRTHLLPTLIVESHLYYSSFEAENKTFFKFKSHDDIENKDVILDYQTRITNKISDFTMKGVLSWFTFFNQTLKTGAEQNNYSFYNKTGSFLNFVDANKEYATNQALFIQDQIETGSLRTKLGLRISRFSPQNKWYSEPRASVALEIEDFTFKASWGRYHQYLTAMNTQDFEVSQFVDYYYPLKNRQPLSSVHYVLGAEGWLSKQLRLSVSAYYKEMPTLYRFDLNSNVGSVLAYNATLEKGHGEAYGAEFLLHGEQGRFSGWVGYSWSHSTRSYPSIQNGKNFLYDGDQTHNLKTLLTYKLSADITISSTFQLTSGYPKTWETGNISHYSYDPATNSYGTFPETITPAKNNVRLPVRILLDLGWKKKLREGFGYQLAEYLGSKEAYFTMSIKNILFLHRNPYMYIYIPDYGYYALDFNFLPFINGGFSIKF